MSNLFFDHPILNSPYDYPERHWELDSRGQPTQNIIAERRTAKFVTPIPKSKKQKSIPQQADLGLTDDSGESIKDQNYETTSIINQVRAQVDTWRALKPHQWQVTPETQRLLQHWRHHPFSNQRPFFCQLEAAETAIWLTEVAPHTTPGKKILAYLDSANAEANPDLSRLALKLATGAGKTTVMAMLIAWQTINAVRRPGSKLFTRGFLLVSPGITIRDRLRVLMPNDSENYYTTRELVPLEFTDEIKKAAIVITNYHAFKLRERLEASKGTKQLLKGRTGDDLQTQETEGQMIQRVMPSLMGMKNILVINDEAHHCYRERPARDEDFIDDNGNSLEGEDLKAAKAHAKKENEAARLWISGLEIVRRKLGLTRVIDLSATPFFLAGSGYREGTMFHWTMSDFSLMDAIECGIVKLPRVPIADNLPNVDQPMFRNLWQHIGKKMPKSGRTKGGHLDPNSLPPQLMTALEALYGHYQKTFNAWQEQNTAVPPCFIVVCNNTASSKLVYDYISGWRSPKPDGSSEFNDGRLPLFRHFDQHGNPLPKPNTLLIDSQQLEAGEALDDQFKEAAADELDRFRRAIVERTGNTKDAANLSDQDILREVMNTVGKAGQLGGHIRCVVSVAMLTEGWDANNVTHVLGVRAFGTQLLCEQVLGRALRRQSYEINEDGPDTGRFSVEYADVFGIPFDFTAQSVEAPIQKPRETIQVKAIRPERDHLEIRFPRVSGYRVELPDDRLEASFTDDSHMEITPEQVGSSEVVNSGIIGDPVNMNLLHTGDVRPSQVLYELTSHIIMHTWRAPDESPQLQLFGQIKRIAKHWLDHYLHCKGSTYPAQLKYKVLASTAAEKIAAVITRHFKNERPITALLDPYNPTGSTKHVRFTTSKTLRWETNSEKSHINWVILDSDWESEFCRVAEQHPKVVAYAKNQNLGLEVPYHFGGESHRYLPDFIVLVDDGHGPDDLLHLVVEIKGFRGNDAIAKADAIKTYWMPGVNHLNSHGRWAFAEFCDVYEIQSDFASKVEAQFNSMIAAALPASA
ncbi:MAG: type III restriction enzyme [Verrucomicrobia bacterium]|nr:MAG: type III restriction enzyme [Verrucomicrobiota bacterium]